MMSVPEEIAAVVAFLASNDESRITGVALPVDAGDTARRPSPAHPTRPGHVSWQ
jgi:enoyl-[acyl-carrier-protein] reductase (NADH)